MSKTLDATTRRAWASGRYVGSSRAQQVVEVQRGYLKRHYASDGHWTATWTATEDWRALPPIQQVDVHWDAASANGIKTATVDIANVYAQQLIGHLGAYHAMQGGWYSPLRAWHPPHGPRKPGVASNEWEDTLTEAAMIRVRQGYSADHLYQMFSGLIDSITGTGRPSTLRLVARDFGGVLVDSDAWGWNINPRYHDPFTFVDAAQVRRYERSHDPTNRQIGRTWRKTAILIHDVTDIAYHALRWAGFPKADLRIQKAGTSLKQSVSFGHGEKLMDLVTAVVNATGFTFFIGLPGDDFPFGRPTLRRSHAAAVPNPVARVAANNILTSFEWQHSDEYLAAIIRTRGKPLPKSKGGTPLSGFGGAAVMDVYRPPWHVRNRDARVLKHVVHTEPLFNTKHECAVYSRMWAMQMALAANTATMEIPAHPGLELDDVVSVVDPTTGVTSRALIYSIQSTFTHKPRAWKQTLSVYLLDNPDVVQVVADLGRELRKSKRSVLSGITVGAAA